MTTRAERPSHRVNVQVESHIRAEGFDTSAIEQAARLVLTMHELEGSRELVVVISDDETLQALNRRFRGEPRPTDVLSFENDTRGPFSGGSSAFPEYLGDIVISLDRAREQAQDAGGTLNQELQLLTVHGVLHLLGYDHGTDGRSRMWEVQRMALKALDADIPLPE